MQRRFIRFLARGPAGWPQRRCDRLSVTVTLSAMAYLLSSHSALSQEAASEQLVFNNACRTCHTIKEGDNRQGPNLYRIIGRKVGSLPDYNYSSAMKGAGFTWDKENLERFIASPDEVVPGHDMKPYGGLASADDRAKVVVYLQSVSAGRP